MTPLVNGDAGLQRTAVVSPAAMSADPSTRVSGKHRLPALEGVRGLAVHIVVLSHMSWGGVFASQALNLKGYGQYAVLLFFVLSAFLLTKQFLDHPPVPGSSVRYWAAYTIRRVLRIYPLYIVSLLWAAASPVASYALAGRTPPSIVRHLLLLDGFKIYWTIPVEMKFYFMLPFILVVARKLCGPRPIRTSAFVLVLLAAMCALFPMHRFVGRSISLRDYYFHFLLGAATAAWWKSVEDKQRSRPVAVMWDVVGLVLLPGILAPWAVGHIFGPSHRWMTSVFVSQGAWFGPAWALVIISTLAGSGAMRWLFETRVLRWAGIVGFSTYVLHMPVIEILRRSSLAQAGREVEWFVILIAVFVTAGLSFWFIEKPFIDLATK